MKTPDEIKKGLEYCSKVKGKCKDCADKLKRFMEGY